MDRTQFLQNYKLEGEDLKIFTYPEKVLSNVAKEIKPDDFKGEKGDELAKLVKDMLFTMYHAPGIGLAAPQIGKSIRLFVIDTQYKLNKILAPNGDETYEASDFCPRVFINPKITFESDELSVYQEGCLSLPEIYEEVERPAKITIEYLNLNGETETLAADNILATCIQHENDHLNGIVLIDHISMIKKNLIKKKLTKKKQNKKKVPIE